MSSPQGSYQSVNVSVNGVVKNLMIPLNSLPSARRLPATITVQPSQDAPDSTQAQTAVSSASSTDQTLCLAADLASAAKSGLPPKLTSLLSTVRFKGGGGGGGHALVAIRPTASVNGAGGIEVEPKTAAATTIGVPVGENRVPLVRSVRPGVKIALPPAGSGLRAGSVSFIRATQLMRPVIRHPVGGAAQGSPRFQYVVQPGSRRMVGPSSTTANVPTTILVKRVGPDEGGHAKKKTVSIRMPPGGGGSSETAVVPPSGVIQLKPGRVLVEVRDSKTNAVRYVQMRRKDPERNSDVDPVASSSPPPPPSPPDSCPPVDEYEAAATEDSKVTEDIKVIEIVPDQDAGESDEPEDGNGEHRLAVATGMPTPPPPPIQDLPDPLPDQEPGRSSPDSRLERARIFGALQCMSAEDATAAASALRPPPEGKRRPNETASDHRLNVIGNTGRVDGDEGDVGADVTGADGRCHDDDEPFSSAAGRRKTFRRNVVPADSVCVAVDKKRNETKTETTKTKRRSARPRAPSPVTAKEAGGRPKTTGEERQGLDAVECRVLLAKTNGSKPYTKWVARHLDQIRSRTGKLSSTRKPEQNEAKIRVDGSRNFKRSEEKETDQTLNLIRAKSDFSIPKCSGSDISAVVGSEKRRNTSNTGRMLRELSDEVTSGGLDMEMTRVVRRRRPGRTSEPTDGGQHNETTMSNESYDDKKSAGLGSVSDPAKTANRTRIRSRNKSHLDDPMPPPLNYSSTQSGTGLDVQKSSDFGTNGVGTSSNTRRSARKPKQGLLLGAQNQDAVADRHMPRRRAAKRKSEPIGPGSHQGEGEFSTPDGAGAPPQSDGDAGGKKKRRRVSRSLADHETFVDVGKSGSSVITVPRQIFVSRSSLLKPMAARAALSPPSLPKLIISSANSADPLATKSTPATPVLSSPTDCRFAAAGSSPKPAAPLGSKPKRGEETKYYLVKTEGGSFLIPVPKSPSNPKPGPVTVAPPPATEDRVEAGDAEGAGSPGPPSSAGQDQSSSGQTGGEYETAVAGMRQEDRISLLKEKLRQQKEQLTQLRRQYRENETDRQTDRDDYYNSICRSVS